MEQTAADHFDLLVHFNILFVTLMPFESGGHAVEQSIGKAMCLRDNSSVNSIRSAVITMPILPPTHLFLKIISMVYGVANSKASKTSKQSSV